MTTAATTKQEYQAALTVLETAVQPSMVQRLASLGKIEDYISIQKALDVLKAAMPEDPASQSEPATE
jgi:hypothetical protein